MPLKANVGFLSLIQFQAFVQRGADRPRCNAKRRVAEFAISNKYPSFAYVFNLLQRSIENVFTAIARSSIVVRRMNALCFELADNGMRDVSNHVKLRSEEHAAELPS